MIADCTLTPVGLDAQRARAGLLRAAVLGVERTPKSLALSFAKDVDRRLVGELIETERCCCAFLDVGYDERARRLHIGIDRDSDTDVLDMFSALFEEEAA